MAPENAEPDVSDESVRETSTGTSVAFEIDVKAKVKQTTQLLNAVYEYLHLVDGLGKLERVEKPSTAICGNEAILRAVETIGSNEVDRKRVGGAGNLAALLFMGARQVGTSRASASIASPTPRRRVTLQISSEDSVTQRAAAWRSMWEAFSRDRSVLIYHLKNHYALVFAMREWQQEEEEELGDDESVGRRQHREILTARKGQRPSAWVAWEEVYSTLCSWSGYKVIRVGID